MAQLSARHRSRCTAKRSLMRQRAAVCSMLFTLAAVPLGCGDAAPSHHSAEKPRSSPAAATKLYRSKAFTVPLMVAVDTKVLNVEPTHDTKHLLYWDAKATDDEKVRFLVPVEVDRVSGPPVDPPRHYLKYIRGLTKRGAKFTDIAHMMVDGRPATLMTATTGAPLDGSVGCSVAGGDRDNECFGFQPD